MLDADVDDGTDAEAAHNRLGVKYRPPGPKAPEENPG